GSGMAETTASALPGGEGGGHCASSSTAAKPAAPTPAWYVPSASNYPRPRSSRAEATKSVPARAPTIASISVYPPAGVSSSPGNNHVTDKTSHTSLAGKRVLVTGGTTGIGRALVKMLVEQGARVLTFGRNQPELDDSLENAGGGSGKA